MKVHEPAVARAASFVPIGPVPSVVLAILSVVGGASTAKSLFPALGALGTAGIRIGLSAIILAAIFRPAFRRLSAAQWRAIVPYGVVLGVMNTLFYLSIERIPLGLAVTLEFTGPLSVAVLGSRRALDLLWVFLAAAGIAIIAPWHGNGLDPLGVALALGAGACWAAYIMLGGRVSRTVSGGAAVSVGMVIAALTIVPATAIAGGFARLTPALMLAGVLVAVLSSVIPYTLEMNALRTLPSRTFGILMSLEPAVAAFVGLLFLREVLSAVQWLSIALVIAASVGASVTRQDSGDANS